MTDDPSRTAELVCFVRATDQKQPPDERVLDDPYAPRFLSMLTRVPFATLVGGLRDSADRLAAGIGHYVLARHRAIDDALLEALPRVEQVVLLGAGYDSRAWRFAEAIAQRPVFEVDHPATSARKARIMEGVEVPDVDRRVVTIDFRHDALEDRLGRAGFQPGAPTFFVWEGVSMYLTRAAVKGTLSGLSALGGPGSRVAMDYWYLLDTPDPIGTAHRMSGGLLHLLGEPLTFGIHPEDVGSFMGREGWTVVDVAGQDELSRRYLPPGRPMYPAVYVVVAERGQ